MPPRMENYAELVPLLASVLALPLWDPESISQVLGTSLTATEARTQQLRCFLGGATRFFSRLELDHPVYGGRLGWTIHITPTPSPPADPVSALRPLLPPDAKIGLVGAPTPGSRGPIPSRHSRSTQAAGGLLSFGLEGADFRGIQSLVSVKMSRPPPEFPPDYYGLNQFRTFAIQQPPDGGYEIERLDSGQTSLQIAPLELKDRKLRISFTSKDPFINEPFAQELIRAKLLDEFLERRFSDQADQLIFANLELGTTTVV